MPRSARESKAEWGKLMKIFAAIKNLFRKPGCGRKGQPWTAARRAAFERKKQERAEWRKAPWGSYKYFGPGEPAGVEMDQSKINLTEADIPAKEVK